MLVSSSKLSTLATLLPALDRAVQGSPRFDLLIAYLVDPGSADDRRRLELFRANDYRPERIAALLGHAPPPYTTRLDAAVPGENIVLSMYSAPRARWVAIHRRPSGEEDMHWGATEPLARRIAALHAMAEVGTGAGIAVAGRLADDWSTIQDHPASNEPDAQERAPAGLDEGDAEPWKILF